MKHTLLIFSAMMLMICSCNSGKQMATTEGICHIQIDPNKAERIKTSDYFKYHSFVALETTDDNLIAKIDKVQVSNSRIYVMDEKQKSVFIFDEKGKYLSKICRHGQGAEEYINLYDFTVDASNGNIRIYDGISKFMLDYSSEGKFIAKRPAPEGFSCARLKNNRWLFYTQQAIDSGFYNVHISNSNLEVTDRFLPFHEKTYGIMYLAGKTRNILSEYNDTIYIMRPLGDKIYVYDEAASEVKPKYQISVAGESGDVLDPNANEQEAKEYIDRLYNGKISFGIYSFHKINSLVFFGYIAQGNLFCIHNKQTGKTICDNKLTDENMLPFNPSVYWTDQERKVMSIVEIGDVNSVIENSKEEINPLIKEISATVKDEDANPILVFYTVQ